MSRGGRRVEGVVFDLDGTLVDTMPFVLEGLAEAVSPYRPRPSPEEVMSCLGGPSGVCVRRLLGGPRHAAAALAAYLEYLRRNDHVARPFRGARTLLRDLRAASVRTGLWTGRERGSTLARLEALSWGRAFDPVVCGDDLPSHKPDPEGLRLILRRWGIAPRHALFVGDSDQDLEGGRAAGVPTVGIRRGREKVSGISIHLAAIVPDPPAAYARVRCAALGGAGARLARG